jgi:hypothetical protein
MPTTTRAESNMMILRLFIRYSVVSNREHDFDPFSHVGIMSRRQRKSTRFPRCHADRTRYAAGVRVFVP